MHNDFIANQTKRSFILSQNGWHIAIDSISLNKYKFIYWKQMKTEFGMQTPQTIQ